VPCPSRVLCERAGLLGAFLFQRHQGMFVRHIGISPRAPGSRPALTWAQNGLKSCPSLNDCATESSSRLAHLYVLCKGGNGEVGSHRFYLGARTVEQLLGVALSDRDDANQSMGPGQDENPHTGCIVFIDLAGKHIFLGIYPISDSKLRYYACLHTGTHSRDRRRGGRAPSPLAPSLRTLSQRTRKNGAPFILYVDLDLHGDGWATLFK
jgi:hypothetical protein